MKQKRKETWFWNFTEHLVCKLWNVKCGNKLTRLLNSNQQEQQTTTTQHHSGEGEEFKTQNKLRIAMNQLTKTRVLVETKTLFKSLMRPNPNETLSESKTRTDPKLNQH